MKYFFSVFLILCFNWACTSQNNAPKDNKDFEFFDITFYSSTCNGTCPDIMMSIDSKKRVQLIRQIFKSKGVLDESKSGGFKGELSKKEFDKLISLIKEINWDSIAWPEKTCCDLPMKTVMVGVNGRTKNFKSMAWPEEANKLIAFLTELGTNGNLPAYSGAMDFDVMKD